MDRKVVFQAAFVASIVALTSVLVMGFGVSLPDPTVEIQPSIPSGTVEDFVRATNEYPELVLRFMAADSLFILSYLMVFIGLHTVVVGRAYTFAWLGLLTGFLTASLDAIENAYLINYALLSNLGMLLFEPDLAKIYTVANLKWMAAFATLYAFGLVWPRESWLERIIMILMLLFPLFGVLGVMIPGLVPYRGLFFFFGMPLFAWYFRRLTHQ
jgi:hypothetical protein